jgi:hypothetical protein
MWELYPHSKCQFSCFRRRRSLSGLVSVTYDLVSCRYYQSTQQLHCLHLTFPSLLLCLLIHFHSGFWLQLGCSFWSLIPCSLFYRTPLCYLLVAEWWDLVHSLFRQTVQLRQALLSPLVFGSSFYTLLVCTGFVITTGLAEVVLPLLLLTPRSTYMQACQWS